ncbi:MAG: sigma-70 domain-containing protein [Solirubrobacteraceae bacterium]
MVVALGREPTIEEIADVSGISPDKVDSIKCSTPPPVSPLRCRRDDHDLMRLADVIDIAGFRGAGGCSPARPERTWSRARRGVNGDCGVGGSGIHCSVSKKRDRRRLLGVELGCW